MRVYYTDGFAPMLPPGHRFPMEKYRLLRERAVAVGILDPADLAVPAAATDAQLALVHERTYLDGIVNGSLDPSAMRRIGFPWSAALVERSRRSVGATIAAARSALEEGVSASLSGGTHHAFPDHGEGFCVFNDVAVATRVLQRDGRVRRVLVLDVDVHQGNGTAFVFRDDRGVVTFDIHGAANYPFAKEAADVDIALPDGTGDEPYLAALTAGLERIPVPTGFDLAFYLGGADPFVGDRLGRLAVSKVGLAERDRLTLAFCRDHGVPVAVVMGGGYASDVDDTVDIHLHVLAEAVRQHGEWVR
jgi:acetoin utilization deacetylase AcuC-like enzyme